MLLFLKQFPDQIQIGLGILMFRILLQNLLIRIDGFFQPALPGQGIAQVIAGFRSIFLLPELFRLLVFSRPVERTGLPVGIVENLCRLFRLLLIQQQFLALLVGTLPEI